MSDPFDLRVRRREVLRGGAGLGLAGWGVNNGAKGDTQRVVKAKIDGDLSYFNWGGYLDPRSSRPNSRFHDFDVDGDRRGGRGPRRDHGHPALASTCARRVRTRSSRIAPEWSD